MHPSIITRIDEEGEKVAMDVCEYLFVHGQRMQNKTMLRPINKLKYGSNSRDDRAEGDTSKKRKDHSKHAEDEEDERRKRKLFQRGLGLFNKLVVAETGVTCTCENYGRFGNCLDSELFGFMCLEDKGYPTQLHAVHFNAPKEGYPTLSKKLARKVLDLVDTGEVSINPPPQDPYEVLHERGPT